MIKFFRRIRQKLMAESRFSKYLFYALGEIVLVMIGILLALQVNNWNQKRINRATLEQFLVEFQYELRFNHQDFKQGIRDIDQQLQIKKNLLNNTRLDTMALDTLELHTVSKYINV